MSTEQQDTRTELMLAVKALDSIENPTLFLLCPRDRARVVDAVEATVARMIADAEQAAERRGAVEALERVHDDIVVDHPEAADILWRRSVALRQGADL